MVFCSLCAKEYDDVVKECLLSHCSACGSTTVDTTKTTRVNPISIVFLGGFFAMILISLAMNAASNLYFLVPLMAVFLGFSFSYGTFSNSTYFCHSCQRRGVTPITKVPIQQNRKDSIVRPAVSSGSGTPLSSAPKIQEKFSLRNILMIVGLIVAIIGMVFGPAIQRAVESALMP